MTEPRASGRAVAHRRFSVWAVLAAAVFLAGCSSLRVGFSIPVGPAGVGVSVGADGSVGAGVGVSVGGASVGVGTSGRLPAASGTDRAAPDTTVR